MMTPTFSGGAWANAPALRSALPASSHAADRTVPDTLIIVRETPSAEKNLWSAVVRFVAVWLEERVLRPEAQLHGADASVTVFGEDELGEIGFGRLLFVIVRVAIQKRHDIG